MQPFENEETNLLGIIDDLRKASLSVQEFSFDYFFAFYEIYRDQLEDEEEKAFLFCSFSLYFLLFMLYEVSDDLSYKRFFPSKKSYFNLFANYIWDEVIATNHKMFINDYHFLLEQEDYSDLANNPFASALTLSLQKQSVKSSSYYDEQHIDYYRLKLEKNFFRLFEKKMFRIHFENKSVENNVIRIKFEFHCPFVVSFNNKEKSEKTGLEMLTRYGSKEKVGTHAWEDNEFTSLLLPCEDSKFGFLFLTPKNKKESIDYFTKQLLLTNNNYKNFVGRVLKYQKRRKLSVLSIPKLNVNFSSNVFEFFKKKNLNTSNLFNFLSNANMQFKEVNIQCNLLINAKGGNIIPDDVNLMSKDKKKKKKKKKKNVISKFVCDRDFILFLVYLPLNLIITFGVIKPSKYQ